MISSRLEPTTDGPYCQLILRDFLRFQNESCIKNQKLRKALAEANGLDLHKLPNISIVLVPEMASKAKELCRGILEIVMQLFDANCEGKTAERIVKEGLDKIENSISQKDKNALEKVVKIQMDVLIKKHLQDYLEFDETTGVYKAKDKTSLCPNTKGLIIKKLKELASGTQTSPSIQRRSLSKLQVQKISQAAFEMCDTKCYFLEECVTHPMQHPARTTLNATEPK